MNTKGVIRALSDVDKDFLENMKWKLSYATSIIDCRCHLCGGLLLHFRKGVCGHWFCTKCATNLKTNKAQVCPIDCTKFDVRVEIGGDKAKIENEIYNLRVHCPHKYCNKIMILGELLDHIDRKCGYFVLYKLQKEHLASNFAEILKNGSKIETVSEVKQPEIFDEETDVCLKMDKLANKLKYVAANGSLEVEGECFSLNHPNMNLTMVTKICLYQDRLEFQLGFDQNCLPFIYYHKRTVQLLDQGQSGNARHIIRVEEPSFGKECAEKWMMSEFDDESSFQPIPIRFLKGDSIYVKDDGIVFRITIEPLAYLYNQFQSKNGTLQWDIHDYQKRKQNELDDLSQWNTSDYFYSGPTGYRMQATVYFDRFSLCGRKCLSIHLDFLNGKHDQSLSELFPHRTIFKILNQDKSACLTRDIQSVVVNTEGHLFGDRIDEFAFLSQIENPPYLVNDTLSIKIIVQPL